MAVSPKLKSTNEVKSLPLQSTKYPSKSTTSGVSVLLHGLKSLGLILPRSAEGISLANASTTSLGKKFAVEPLSKCTAISDRVRLTLSPLAWVEMLLKVVA